MVSGVAERTTEYLPLDQLKPHPDNPKDHEVGGIGTSMTRLGYIEQITLDERTGFLIAGHGRRESLIAARDGGETPPEGIIAQDDGDWAVPVSRGWASRDDDEAKAALVALNRWNERGGWKREQLADILDDLQSSFGLEALGFENDDLSILLSETGALGERAGSFLDDLAGDARPGSEGGAPIFSEARSLQLTFSSLPDRDEAIGFLKSEMREQGVDTMAAAILGLARRARTP